MLVLVSLLSCLLGSGVGLAFFAAKNRAHRDKLAREFQLPDRLVKELEQVLELRDDVSRDASVLTSTIATQSSVTPAPLANAIDRLLKTTESLAGRLSRLGAEARIARPEPDFSSGAAAGGIELSAATALPAPPVLSKTVVDASPRPAAVQPTRLPASPFDDARRFPRSSFRGAAKATIYPCHPGPGREPVQCDVLTRDLSCGGIGIAHSEQLFPKQIVVLDAVGRLLVGEIRWCRRVDEQFYVAGCRLVKTNE